MNPGLIIVSNRLPVSVKKVDGKLEFSPSNGGLATGLASYSHGSRNKWIGWPGIASDELTEHDRQQIGEELKKDNCYPVFLTQKQIDEYYNGYSNSVLWPTLHSNPIGEAAADDSTQLWKTYRHVNELFAETVLALSSPGSNIWVHDYQLLILPALLRRERPRDKIGFFLHTPFPPAKKFKELKEAVPLMLGLLGADLVGLQTAPYVSDFLDTIQQLDIGVTTDHNVILDNRVVRVTNFPISIDYAKYEKARKSQAVNRYYAKFRLAYAGQKVILMVDRLDPAKNLIARLNAYRELLRENPRLRGKVVLVALVMPSRESVSEYKQLKQDIDQLVRETNDEFSVLPWIPIDYIYDNLPFEQVTALYRRADVAFIAPKRDGMNLVAKEYVASQPQQKGALVLSSTIGAAQELKDAIMVDPARPKSLVRGLSKALAMPQSELKKRVTRMQEQLATSNVHVWAKGFTKALNQDVKLPLATTKTLDSKVSASLVLDYTQAEKRLLLLDYDGVLERFHSKPQNAHPSTELKSVLKKLGQKSQVVVISGRRKADLEEWLGDLPIALVAEHGLYTKRHNDKDWHTTTGAASRGWRGSVLLALEKFAAKTPGAIVEEKDASLVWHYRKASPYYAQKYLVTLKRVLKPIAKKYHLQLEQGNKILEIRPADINKGTSAKAWLKTKPDFVLVMGDDYTDEDMFAALPPTAHSIKVGRGRTVARYRIKNVHDVLELLEKLSS